MQHLKFHLLRWFVIALVMVVEKISSQQSKLYLDSGTNRKWIPFEKETVSEKDAWRDSRKKSSTQNVNGDTFRSLTWYPWSGPVYNATGPGAFSRNAWNDFACHFFDANYLPSVNFTPRKWKKHGFSSLFDSIIWRKQISSFNSEFTSVYHLAMKQSRVSLPIKKKRQSRISREHFPTRKQQQIRHFWSMLAPQITRKIYKKRTKK